MGSIQNIKTIILLILTLSVSLCACPQAQDERLLPLLKEELQYNMQELQKQELPPYYMSLRVEDIYQVDISSEFGSILKSTATHLRTVAPQVRIGDKNLDNFRYSTQGTPGGQQRQAVPTYIPVENNFADGIRSAIWQETQNRYEFACSIYEQTKSKAATSVADEDKAPCFSDAPVEKYYEAPLPESQVKIDRQAWEKRLNEISSAFKAYPELQYGSSGIDFQVKRTYFVNTEGSEIVQNRVAARIMLSAQVKADDGMDLPLSKDYFAYSPEDLPTTAQMVADVKDLINRLRALRQAPVADPYTGPAILSGAASGVFFHEIFGHRLEGHRLKTGGQTFKKMVDEQILPKEFQVYSDPTLRSYAGTDMNGSYLYDDEGIKARRVNNVVNGVLKEFLMSRIPIDGFPVSNGHGRTSGAHDPVSRQSNFIVETTKPYTDIELRKMLIEEAKKQGKSYGYYYKSVTSGFTFTGENGSLNSFNVKPLEVYRVFTDGRPDELVRGVDLIGTPLAMFSNIVAAGDKASVFTGSCGAESGWVPVTASSPDIFVSQIETQRRQQSRDIPPILPAPEFKDTVITGIDDVILGAMRDELKRNQENLILPGAPRPFYLSFLASRYRQFQIIAKLGGIHSSVFTPWRMAGTTQVLVGDFKRNSELQPGESINTPLPSDADYSGIRRNYWGASDVAYKYALNNYSQKIAYLKANPLPNEMEKLPEMQRLAPVTKIEQSKRPYTIDQAKLEQTAAELSAIFLDYKYLTNTSVEISGAETENYRYTSENVQLKQPQGNIRIKVTAAVRVNDGSNVMDVYEVVGANPADLPPLNALKEKVTALADNLMKQKEAPIVEDYYSGPIMLEDDATASILIENLLGRDGLVAKHSLSSGGKSIADKLEKKILDPRITIKNYSDLPEYNGVSLMGCYTTDADGITPAKELTLVDKGILRQLLNDRYPALKAPKSTGSQRFTNQAGSVSLLPSIGTLHIQAESGIDRNKMKEALLQAAKKEKLDFSYIIRCPQGCTSLQVYKVDVKSGEETLVRTSNLTLPTLEKLTDLVAISSEENVKNRDNNCNTSVIYPAVIIVREMEIGRPNIKSSKAPALPYPLQRRN